MSRRRFLALGTVAAANIAALPGSRPSRIAVDPIVDLGNDYGILPRSAWADGLAPKGALTREDDVRFLLVHHTVTSNTYRDDQVAAIIRSFYEFHTGPEKGWPDVAYNFLIDRFGRIWEARERSADEPIRGSATGGSQGFALLCSFIGDHTSDAPTAEAQEAMVRLLAWLGDRYDVDTRPGATTEFVSRGSNKHERGTTVSTPTIQGHRGMSLTSCPGDAAFALVERGFPERATAQRGLNAATTTASTTSASETTTTGPTDSLGGTSASTTTEASTSATSPTTDTSSTATSSTTGESSTTEAPTTESSIAESAATGSSTTEAAPATTGSGDASTSSTASSSTETTSESPDNSATNDAATNPTAAPAPSAPAPTELAAEAREGDGSLVPVAGIGLGMAGLAAIGTAVALRRRTGETTSPD